MPTPQFFAVIIAGGKGERFWPQSRERRPKHLLPIVGDKPMLAQTLDRIRPVVPAQNTFVITSATQEKAVREVCARAKLPRANIVAVDYDPGASEVNQLNRIKLMLSAARRNQAKAGM